VVNEFIGEYFFDWRQLQRWKVPEDKLPSDSRVDFKEFSIWDLYKWKLIGGSCFLVLQSLLVIALLFNSTRRKKAEAVIRESEERYRAILEQSSDAIVIVEIDSRMMLEVNRRWTEMMGYSAEEARKLSTYDVVANTPEHVDAIYQKLLQQNRLHHEVIRLRRKDGRSIEVERSGAVIQYAGKKVFMFINRDISEERKLQALLGKDVALAADVQRSLVPGNFEDALVSVKTIYAPHHLVSGDFYDFAWSQENKNFSGFILDVSGHGVGSSLQGIAVSTYFREVLESQMNLTAKLKWINQHVLRYFTDETFAAAIYFEFDFIRKTLKFATAGVYGFLAHNAELPTFVKKAGSLIGISETPEYTEWIVPIQTGDAFYFMSDGIFDQLNEKDALPVGNFEQTLEMLRCLAQGPGRRDDCCAVCVRVSGKSSFPATFDFYRPGEYSRIRSRIHDLFYQIAGKETGRIDVAVGEALNNAARESMNIKVKINLLGSRLVIRVKDGGDGFNGNARVAEFSNAAKNDAFEERLFAESGRGILIMVSWMDRVVYNRKGNELLLMKRLP
jgi:PAS domain S-box-containing protein